MLIWSTKSTFLSILMVKNLRLKNKIFDEFLVLWMLHKFFHSLGGCLHPFMCDNSLLTKLMVNDGKNLIASPLVCLLDLVIHGGRWGI